MGIDRKYSTENKLLIVIAIGVCVLIALAISLDISESKAMADDFQKEEVARLVKHRYVGTDAKTALADGVVTQREYNSIISKLNVWRRRNAR